MNEILLNDILQNLRKDGEVSFYYKKENFYIEIIQSFSTECDIYINSVYYDSCDYDYELIEILEDF